MTTTTNPITPEVSLCENCPDRLKTYSGKKCMKFNTHLWEAKKSCPKYASLPAPLPSSASVTQVKAPWLNLKKVPHPTGDPKKVITISKFGIKKKNPDFRVMMEVDPDDNSVCVMRRWDVWYMEERGKAYKVIASFSLAPSDYCRCCGKELTNPVSVVAGMGPICAGRIGVTSKNERDAMDELTKYIGRIGHFEMFIPKSWVEHIEDFDPASHYLSVSDEETTPTPPTTPTVQAAPESTIVKREKPKQFFNEEMVPWPCQGCPDRNGEKCGKDSHNLKGFWMTAKQWVVPEKTSECDDFKGQLS